MWPICAESRYAARQHIYSLALLLRMCKTAQMSGNTATEPDSAARSYRARRRFSNGRRYEQFAEPQHGGSNAVYLCLIELVRPLVNGLRRDLQRCGQRLDATEFVHCLLSGHVLIKAHCFANCKMPPLNIRNLAFVAQACFNPSYSLTSRLPGRHPRNLFPG